MLSFKKFEENKTILNNEISALSKIIRELNEGNFMIINLDRNQKGFEELCNRFREVFGSEYFDCLLLN
jgi:hypothetical protein